MASIFYDYDESDEGIEEIYIAIHPDDLEFDRNLSRDSFLKTNGLEKKAYDTNSIQ